MASDYSGTAQYHTFSDLAAHDLPSPTLNWTVAAVVWTDTIAAGERHVVTHADIGAGTCGWRFYLNADKIAFVAVGLWGQLGTATTALSAGAWYGIAASKAASGTLVTYTRYLLSTETFASESIDTFGNTYTDGASPSRLGGVWTGADTLFLWDGRIARAAIDIGTTRNQAALKLFFDQGGVSTGWTSRWDLPSLTDSGTAGATLTNVSTTTIDDPPPNTTLKYRASSGADVLGADDWTISYQG